MELWFHLKFTFPTFIIFKTSSVYYIYTHFFGIKYFFQLLVLHLAVCETWEQVLAHNCSHRWHIRRSTPGLYLPTDGSLRISLLWTEESIFVTLPPAAWVSESIRMAFSSQTWQGIYILCIFWVIIAFVNWITAQLKCKYNQYIRCKQCVCSTAADVKVALIKHFVCFVLKF